jgi:hypothetical protein
MFLLLFYNFNNNIRKSVKPKQTAAPRRSSRNKNTETQDNEVEKEPAVKKRRYNKKKDIK